MSHLELMPTIIIDLQNAIRLIRAIERYDIEHVEQPISRYDILGMV